MEGNKIWENPKAEQEPKEIEKKDPQQEIVETHDLADEEGQYLEEQEEDDRAV
jgi:hypothetical protein